MGAVDCDRSDSRVAAMVEKREEEECGMGPCVSEERPRREILATRASKAQHSGENKIRLSDK
jgi:hypothetical protein